MDQNREFGKGSFQIIPLLQILKEDIASYNVICEKWEELGYSLFLDGGEIKGLRTMLEMGELALDNLPRQMLRIWKDAHRNKANLEVLCEALNDIKLYDLAGAIHGKFGGGVNPRFPPPSKRPRLIVSDHYEQDSWNEFDDSQDSEETINHWTAPKEDVSLRLFRAIREGYEIEKISFMIKHEAANVNVKTEDDLQYTTAHAVIFSLIDQKRSCKDALAVLELLVTSAVNSDLINQGDRDGCTPLWHLMQFEDLDADLLTWFHSSGADFNVAHQQTGDSVLFEAKKFRQGSKIILKILKCDGNPKHVNKAKRNALHLSARIAHASALAIFINKCGDVNARDADNHTALHHLFSEKDLDYQECLTRLANDGTDFEVKCNHGTIPLEKWIGNATNRTNPFPTLMILDEILPLTEETASLALTVIVGKMKTLQKFLPFEDEPNDFVEYIEFLVKDIGGKLRLKDEEKWKNENWERFLLSFGKMDVLNKLKRLGYGELKDSDQLLFVRGTCLGKLVLEGWESSMCIPIEILLLSLLACKEHVNFVELCNVVGDFCVPK